MARNNVYDQHLCTYSHTYIITEKIKMNRTFFLETYYNVQSKKHTLCLSLTRPKTISEVWNQSLNFDGIIERVRKEKIMSSNYHQGWKQETKISYFSK